MNWTSTHSKRHARYLWIAAWAAAGLAGGPHLSRGDCIEYGDYLHFRGSVDISGATQVKVAGSHAYVLGDSLCVVDITDLDFPVAISKIAVHASNEFSAGLALSGQYAYVGIFNSTESLKVIDISDPSLPVIVGQASAGVHAGSVAVQGAFAYVSGSSTLSIIDISNPVSPTPVKSVTIPRQSGSVAVAGNYAFVVGQLGLTAVDISIANSAAVVGGIDIPGLNGSITVHGDYAYVGDPIGVSGTGDDLQIVDISDPTAPVVVNSVPTKSIEVVIVGDRLYQAFGFGSGFRVFDLSDPVSPAILGSINLPEKGSAISVDVSGDFAYLLGTTRLHVVDLTNPTSAVPLGSAELPGAPYIYPSSSGIALAGNRAYVAGGPFTILDVSNPLSPSVLGAVEGNYDYLDVALSGTYAYTVGLDSLKAFNVVDPASPSFVGGTPVHGAALAVSGSIACVAARSEGLQIFGISNPESLAILGHADIPGDCEDVLVNAGYAFVAAGEGGLQVVDISAPETPAVVGHVDTPHPVHAMALNGSLAYLGSPFGFLYVADVSDPTTPLLIGSTTVSAGGLSVAVAGEYAYVAASYAGIQILDVSDPASPAIVGSCLLPNIFEQREASGVAVAGSFAYLSDGELFSVLPTQCSAPVSVQLLSFEAQAGTDGVSVTWAASEASDQAGFNIDRSTAIPGPYRRLNAQFAAPSRVHRFLDTDVIPGTTYFYRLEAVDRAGNITYFGPIAARMGEAVLRNRLGRSHPNPLGAGSAEIDFELAKRSPTRLTIYDALGRRVREVLNTTLDAGPHHVSWDGRDDRGSVTSPGVYFYRFEADGFIRSQRLVRVR